MCFIDSMDKNERRYPGRVCEVGVIGRNGLDMGFLRNVGVSIPWAGILSL